MTNPAPRTWPLLAPGMPPPGPDFVAHAAALGDTDTKAGKRKSDGIVAVGPLLQRLYDRCLLQPGFEVPVRLGPGRVEPVAFIPGGRWGDRHGVWLAPDADDPNRPLPGPGRGPVPSRVMVIGKMPGPEEERFGRALCGPAAACLLESLQLAHAEGVADWYTTNLVKFRPPLPSTNVQAAWRADCLPLLQMEIRLVRPELILCLGADALQAVLGKGAKVGDLDGRVETLRVPCGREPGSDEAFECRVTAVVSPAEVLRDVGRRRQFDAQIARVAALAAGRRWDVADTDVDHRLCTTLEQADLWLAEAEAHLATLEPKDRWVAWDAEWHGSHPVNAGSYLRTVQISWREKQAVVFALTRQGGEPCLPAAPLAERLNKFMKGKRAVGHFLVADLEWLHHYGFRPTDDCPMPLDPGPGGEAAWELWRDGRGWADTGLLAHCVEETAELGLDALATRYCGVHRYDLPLAEWRDRYCAEHKIKRAALEGYGECPNSTLEGELQSDGVTLKDSYAGYDSDVTLRLVRKLLPLVERDYDGNCVWEPAWASMLTCEPILAIHKAGIAVDRARLDELTDVFRTARAALEEEIQSDKWANWPDLNLRSILQVKELLFGERHGKKDKDTGQPVRQRPDGAVSLELTPTLTTGRRQRPWADVVERGQEKDYAPSTNKVALGLLIADAPTEFAGELVGKVRDHRYLDQVLKGFLRDPLAPDEEGGDEPAEEATPTLVLADGTPVSSADAGFYEYDGGLATFIDDDGRVRTHLYPTTDSSRLRSARPNLQNASKSRDDDFRKLLGSAYKHKLRSVFTAGPGRVLIERDYKTAELFILSIMAGDAVMEDHCRRANLPESGFDAAGREVPGGKYPHPDFYDIHSNVAVLAFRLTVNDFVHLSEPEDRGKPGFGKTCAELLGLPVGAPLPANKAAFKYAGLAKFRTLAKAVLFGLCYGRGAKAIAMQARMEGVRGVGVFEAERIIRTIFDLYPGLERFFAACRARVVDPGYIVNPHGRIRRFPRTADRGALADAERQAMNYVPQSEVADLSHRAMARLQRAIVEHGLEGDVALVLQIHDALLVECREDPALIDYVANTLMPYAMTHSNPILQCDLDGRPTGREAVYLETDCEIMSRWGVKYDGPVTAAVAA